MCDKKKHDDIDNENAVRQRESEKHYADLLERLKREAMSEKQRERMEKVEKEDQGKARITYRKD